MDEKKKAKKADKTKYDIAYAKQNIKRVPLDMQKADYEALKAAADARSEKVNEYIKIAIRERMARDKIEGESMGDGFNIGESPAQEELDKLLNLPRISY